MTLGLDNFGEEYIEDGSSLAGVAVGVVTQNKDETGQARVKVRFGWHDQPKDSYWARVASPMSGKDRGFYTLPEVGDEVLVAFERGDIRHPFVLGGLWNPKDGAPVKNGDGKNDVRKFRSRAGHELTFDDGTKPQVELRTKGGKKLLMDDEKVDVTDEKGNHLVISSTDGSITLKCTGSLKIDALSVEIKAQTQMKLDAGAILTINGALVKIN
jgi:uncharacterized protein involved in type VI secretion and phage assembly